MYNLSNNKVVLKIENILKYLDIQLMKFMTN